MGFGELGNRGTTTKCLREQGKITNFGRKKLGTSLKVIWGTREQNFKILSHLSLNQVCISKMTTY